MVAVGLLMGLASARSATAAVGNSDANVSGVPAAKYSTGRSGGKLKWVSPRPALSADAEEQVETAVKATGYATPSESPRPLPAAQKPRPAPSSGLSGDLFGQKKNVPTPAPPEKLSKDFLQSLPAEPKPQGSPPAPNPGEPVAPEKPYVAPNGPAPLNRPKPEKNGTKPSLEQEFALRQHDTKEICPSPKDLKKISELTTNITPPEGDIPHDCPLDGATFQPRAFAPITYAWTASAVCHKPLYFEDVQLERYGHMAGPWVQPFASAANFFLTVPILPYKWGLEPWNECIYPLGFYRPGDCAPYMFDPIPLSVRGALFEGCAWVGGVAAIP
jgi:hypothetical protein